MAHKTPMRKVMRKIAPTGGWGTTRTKRVSTCHPDLPHYARGFCRACYRVQPEARQARHRYYKANPERWQGYGERQRQLRTREAVRYGTSPEALQLMMITQAGRCLLCGNSPKRKQLAVDHDHGTGAVRGLLCHPCNGGLGQFRDDPDLLERAAAYLRGHQA